jgi:hypothetical protein
MHYGPASSWEPRHRARPHTTTTDEFANANFDHVAPTEFAVDRNVGDGPIAQPALAIEPKPDRPNLLWFECALRAELPTFIPWAPLSRYRIMLRMSHRRSPIGNDLASRRYGERQQAKRGESRKSGFRAGEW